MGHAQLSTKTEGVLIRLSKFLKSCAPYNVTTPGYSVLYATINAYKALAYTHVLSRLKNFISNSTIKSYQGTMDWLMNLLDLGSDRADKGFTTLYEGYEEQEEFLSNDMRIERSTRSARLTHGVCAIISGMVAGVAAILTIVSSAVLICISAAILPLMPLVFLMCTTAAVEQYAVSRVRSVFRTDVRDDISEYIERHLSGPTIKKFEKLKSEFGALLSLNSVSVTEGKIYNKPTKLALAGEALSMSGEVLTLACLTPFFLLVAPLSLVIASTVFLLSLCSLDKKAIDRNIKIMSNCTADFLPIVAAARTGAITHKAECPSPEIEEVVVKAQTGHTQQHPLV